MNGFKNESGDDLIHFGKLSENFSLISREIRKVQYPPKHKAKLISME